MSRGLRRTVVIEGWIFSSKTELRRSDLDGGSRSYHFITQYATHFCQGVDVCERC